MITAGDYGDTIRICPPLIATEENVETALKALDAAVGEVDIPAASTSAPSKSPEASAFKIRTGSATFSSEKAHRDHIEKTCPLPPGFRVGAGSLKFHPKELGEGSKAMPMKVSMIALEQGKATKSYAAVLTKNAFPGAPIRVSREIVQSGAPIGAILVNNKVSNVHPHGGGVKDAEQLANEAAKALGLPADARVLPASTGVIGWSLPVKEMSAIIPDVAKKTASSGSALIPAEAIMTTDRYPKARSVTISIGGKEGRITGVAKGAGMIEPNMATMLVYVMTDITMPQKRLQMALNDAVNGPGSFNRMSIDSDQSTSDMVVLLSSDKVEAKSEEDMSTFAAALKQVCTELSEDIVRNGEGTKHVIRVTVKGSPSEELAHGVGKAIANSLLVKTAIFGNDPNVGRIIAALGSYLGKQKSMYIAKNLSKKTVVKVGGVVVFEKGEFALDSTKEEKLNKMMMEAEMDYSKGDYPPHERCVDIEIDLNGGDAYTVVLGSDLSPEYVDVNGNYRS